jgi:23S rRNA (cytidine1920-2'-O)/16S rRNA (cytidine1409-2'-O)-methyltransferase
VGRVRLDQLLVLRGMAVSRADAQARILAGEVSLVDSPGRHLKPGQLVAEDVPLALATATRWASRGGEKLVAALDAFGVDPGGLSCLDAGASTGGFTDVLLDRGARVVYAVDVGRGQLVERLRRDPRVVVRDRTNLRTLTGLPEPIDLATLDLSFISLGLVLPAVRGLLSSSGRVVALVKPQFEAGREQVPSGGVVRDPLVHRSVLESFAAHARAAGFTPRGLVRSPITGGSGNVEFLALLDGEGTWDADAWMRTVDARTRASA